MAGVQIEDQALVDQLCGIVEWIRERPDYNNQLAHLIERIGATIAGVKPAELLTFPLCKGKLNKQIWEESKPYFFSHNEIRLIELTKKNGTRQVFFYHGSALHKTLCHSENLNFLKSLNYPERYSVESYVSHLAGKLLGQRFPHEIGIFLGYPLKDVLGFMGYLSLELVKTNGWRVYGDEALSNRTYEGFLKARARVVTLFNRLQTDS